MEIEIVRINKFEKGNFRGFATIKLIDGDTWVQLEGFTIVESKKTGKLMGLPPSKKNEKTNEYSDQVRFSEDMKWKVSDAIVAAYEGDSDNTSTSDTSTTPTAASAKAAMIEGGKTKVKSTQFDPWAEEA